MSHIDVAIIGSGVAGLSAAISLQKLGLNVVVYEKDKSFASRKQGYGMTLTNSLNGPLAALGILDACIEKSCVSSCHYIFNQMGDVLGYYGRELQDENIHTDRSNDGPKDSLSALVESTKDNKHPSDIKFRDYGGHRGNLRIPRQELRLMLLKQLLPDTVRWSHELLDYFDLDDHVELTVCSVKDLREENKQVRALVLIGADGIRSKVRRLRDAKLGLLHRSPLTYLGQRSIPTLLSRSIPTLLLTPLALYMSVQECR
jgi:2-polyprenyl-6-methoxyphenol hydroxylase-like FAD-dependent oxidoreductase